MTRNHKFFHLVAIDQRKRRNAKPIELLGVYHHRVGTENSDREAKEMQWSVDRIKYWLGVGAQPSKPVVKLLEMGRIIPPDSPYHPKAMNAPPKAPVPSTSQVSAPEATQTS